MGNEINRKSQIIALPGATLDIVNRETGEILHSILLDPGVYPATQFAGLVGPGEQLQAGANLSVLQKPSGVHRATHPGLLASDANPDFQPTSASRAELEMRHHVARMKGLEKKLDAKLKSLEKIDRVPTAPSVQPEPVPDPVVEPAPEVKTA